MSHLAPMKPNRCRIGVAWLAIALLAGISGMAAAQRYVPGSDPALPRLKYADSLLSLNDRCIVAGNKLNPRVRPVYVNRLPIGFC